MEEAKNLLNLISSLSVPIIISFTAVYALFKKVDVYDSLVCGAEDGLSILAKMLPSIVALFCAIHMMRASGALDFICMILKPVSDFLGIPSECTPLMLLRPLSGSAALAYGSEIIASNGADSYIGRVCAVMLGASETTFYTIAVYFGSLKIRDTRYAIPAALCADFAGFAAAALAVRLFF